MTAALLACAVAVPPAPAAAADCVGAATELYPAVPWAQLVLAPDRVWSTTRGAGVTVAVLDSGVDARARQLSGRVLPGRAVVADAGPPDRDCSGHGTAAAGIVAAARIPGTGLVGIAPAARILPVLTGTDGTADPAVVARGIRTAVGAGAGVVLVSGSQARDDPALRAAVDAAVRADAVVVAPVATNRDGEPSYPAGYPGVLAVAGVGPAGTGGGGLGGTTPGQRVDLVAPADQLVSLGVGSSGHVGAEGTGLAAAYVAGTVALLRAARPELSAADVVRRVLVTAAPAAGPRPHPRWGYGTLDPYAAVTSLGVGTGRAEVRPVRVVPPARPVPPDTDRRNAALLVGVGALALAGLCAAAVLVTRHGRHRGWKPA